ncbi:hypothetical protein AAEX63_07980 [Luteococcus sp. H138]|uniref:hypothetical protein n=1 Tax=unclassified Luteococcus TaxID=2639923 RepID=UPI00313E2729
MIESRDWTLVDPPVDGLSCDRWAEPNTPHRIPIVLALVTVVLFGIGCTMLGAVAARTAHPCLNGCSPLAMDLLALRLMTWGPAAVSAVSCLITLWRASNGRNQPWICSVLGCVGGVACVAIGSAMLGIF